MMVANDYVNLWCSTAQALIRFISAFVSLQHIFAAREHQRGARSLSAVLSRRRSPSQLMQARRIKSSCCVMSSKARVGSVYVIHENGGNLFGPQTRSDAVHANVEPIKQRSASCISGWNFSNSVSFAAPCEASTLERATGMMMLVMMTMVARRKESDDRMK
jgi:hypothetical protein